MKKLVGKCSRCGSKLRSGKAMIDKVHKSLLCMPCAWKVIPV